MAPDSYVHAVVTRAIRIKLGLFQHLKHPSVKWDVNEFSILHCPTHCGVTFSYTNSICATIHTEGNNHTTWMPVVNGVLFPQEVLQAWQAFLLHFKTYKLDKKWSYSPSSGNTIKLQEFIHSPSQVPLWPGQKQRLCSSMASFQSKYTLASQQGLLM